MEVIVYILVTLIGLIYLSMSKNKTHCDNCKTELSKKSNAYKRRNNKGKIILCEECENEIITKDKKEESIQKIKKDNVLRISCPKCTTEGPLSIFTSKYNSTLCCPMCEYEWSTTTSNNSFTLRTNKKYKMKNNMNTRFLINCSGSKNTNSTNTVASSIRNLSFDNKLYKYRKHIIKKSGIELDWDNCLPAYELYTGKLYKQITTQNWNKSETNIYILSALFGWIKHTDLLPYYDLSMNQQEHKINGRYVNKIWYDFSILHKFISRSKDIDLLTQPYRKAICNSKNPVAQTPYAKFKDNYGTGKGKWLNSLLDKY